MTRRAPKWLLQGSFLNVGPPAAADLPRLTAFLARRDLVQSPFFAPLLPEGKIPGSRARPEPGRRVLALAARDLYGAPAGLFVLGPGPGTEDLALGFAVPADGGDVLREGLRLVLSGARRRTPAERVVLGETKYAPYLDAILLAVGFRRDALLGWIYVLIEGSHVPMRIVRAH